MKMNKNLITELNHQRKLMGLLKEGIVNSFVEGMKNVIKICVALYSTRKYYLASNNIHLD